MQRAREPYSLVFAEEYRESCAAVLCPAYPPPSSSQPSCSVATVHFPLFPRSVSRPAVGTPHRHGEYFNQPCLEMCVDLSCVNLTGSQMRGWNISVVERSGTNVNTVAVLDRDSAGGAVYYHRGFFLPPLFKSPLCEIAADFGAVSTFTNWELRGSTRYRWPQLVVVVELLAG